MIKTIEICDVCNQIDNNLKKIKINGEDKDICNKCLSKILADTDNIKSIYLNWRGCEQHEKAKNVPPIYRNKEFAYDTPIENEIWKPIKGFEGLYEVSNMGRIKSLPREIILKQGVIVKGYLGVCLYKNKKGHSKRVHRLVAQAFLDDFDKYESVNHKDGNKQNNCVSNLEMVTAKGNTIHAKNFGLLTNDKKKICCVETNKIYDSITSCAEDLKVDFNTVDNACRNGALINKKHYIFLS